MKWKMKKKLKKRRRDVKKKMMQMVMDVMKKIHGGEIESADVIVASSLQLQC